MSVIEEIVIKYVPLKTSIRRNRLKIPRDRRILMKKMRRLQTQMNLKISDIRKSRIQNKLVKNEMALQKSHATANSHREAKAIDAIKKNSKYFFTYAKKFSKTQKPIGPLLNQNNEYTSSSKEMASILSKQYGSVFSTPMEHSDEFLQHQKNPVLDDLAFTETDIIDAIDELSNSSASLVQTVFLQYC